jgi:hypothetical protein
MKRPSERALDLAETILDHVRYGLTRADALYELAEMIDASNQELLDAVTGMLRDAERGGGLPGPDAVLLLRETLDGYQPLRPLVEDQRDLFVPQPATLF